MSEPAADPRRLDPAQARRLLGAMSLRPSERVLCLGPEGAALGGVAAILVGPTGHIEEADPAAAAGETLPYPDDGFDAVVIDLTTPHPEQSHLLTEVARVTAPTGRVAFAMPRPADGNPEPVQQLGDAAGLRGVATRSDPAADSESEPVEFVTAFPPLPASADSPTTVVRRPKPAGQPGRRRLLVAAAALVVAAAAGVAWGLAGAGPGDVAPGGGSGPLAGDTELDIDQRGAEGQLAAEDAPAGGGLPTDNSDADSSSGSGNGSGSAGSSGSGGGQPSNRPPDIESPGLTSAGLLLTIAAKVTDPDGDDVSLLFDIDGMEVDPAQTCSHPTCKGEEQPGDFPTVAGVRLDFADIGYRSDVAVTITATDSHGATTRETYSHTISASTRVSFRDLNYAIDDPSACFSETDSRVLSFTVVLDGAVPLKLSRDQTISTSNASGTLDTERPAGWHGKQPPPLEVFLSATLSDIGTTAFAAPRTYTGNAEETVNVFRKTPCAGSLTYVITFTTT